MKYNLRQIMIRAWKLFHEKGLAFAEALHRAWLSAKAEVINAKRVEAAKEEAGITEETNTWSGWKKSGYVLFFRQARVNRFRHFQQTFFPVAARILQDGGKQSLHHFSHKRAGRNSFSLQIPSVYA